MLLQGGDGHDALMCVEQMGSGFLGLHLARALHENACDDLKGIGDPMLQFLKQNRLVSQQVVLVLSRSFFSFSAARASVISEIAMISRTSLSPV